MTLVQSTLGIRRDHDRSPIHIVGPSTSGCWRSDGWKRATRMANMDRGRGRRSRRAATILDRSSRRAGGSLWSGLLRSRTRWGRIFELIEPDEWVQPLLHPRRPGDGAAVRAPRPALAHPPVVGQRRGRRGCSLPGAVRSLGCRPAHAARSCVGGGGRIGGRHCRSLRLQADGSEALGASVTSARPHPLGDAPSRAGSRTSRPGPGRRGCAP
jgi:hypothetical protein